MYLCMYVCMYIFIYIYISVYTFVSYIIDIRPCNHGTFFCKKFKRWNRFGDHNFTRADLLSTEPCLEGKQKKL